MSQQQPTQTQALTPQLISDLLALIADPKQQVRHGTLNVILQFTSLPESKRKFNDTNLLQLLIKNVFTKGLTTICLSNMINLSSQQCFQDKFSSVIKPLLVQIKNWKDLELELSLMLLINLSKIQQCSDIIIGKDDMQGYFVEQLFHHLQKPKMGAHVTNIFSNITSFDNGRKLFAKNCIPNKLKQHLFSEQRERRVSVLKTIRNTLFQWQDNNFITKLLDQKEHFIDDITLYLTFVLQSSHHFIKDKKNINILLQSIHLLPYQYAFNISNHHQQKQSQQIILTLDLLVILTNVDFQTLKPEYRKKQFKILMDIMSQCNFPEEDKDKIEALNIFFC